MIAYFGIVCVVGFGLDRTSVIGAASDPAERALSIRKIEEQALAALKQWDYSWAIAMLQQVLRSDPQDASAYVNLGYAYSQMGEYEQATTAYRNAIDLDPGLLQSHLGLAYIAYRRGRVEEAVQAYRSLAKQRPELAEAHHNLGLIYAEQGEIERAIKAEKAAITADPGFADAHYQLGNLYAKSNQEGMAMQRYRTAIRLDPEMPEPYYRLARLYQQVGDKQGAQEMMKRFRRLKADAEELQRCIEAVLVAGDDEKVSALLALGVIYLGQNKYPQAAGVFQQVLRREPKSAEAYAGLGHAALEQEDYPRATQYYERSLELGMSTAEVHHNVGLAYMQQRQSAKAQVHFLESIRLNPENAPSHLMLATLYAAQDKFEQAEQHYQRTLELQPDMAVGYHSLAYLYGQYDLHLSKAVELADKAIQLAPRSALYRNTLSWLLYKQGDFQAAEQAALKATELAPENPIYQEGLAEIRRAMASSPMLLFTPVTVEAGIEFHHVNGATGQKYLPETMGGGVTFFDYNRDGALDIYLVNGAALPGWDTLETPTNHLYRNNGDGTFIDVTQEAGVGDAHYGLGCCVGDYDNDSYLDLYVTNFGPNVLYHNNGDGTFTDVTSRARVGDPGFSTGCAFADYDNDGDLDLFVANYVLLDLMDRPECSQRGIRAYCRPEEYLSAQDTLYRNNGDGTFTDMTQQARLTSLGRGLGAVWGDMDGDGHVDLFVANDRMENFLYQNQGDGTFVEIGEFAGVALNEHGYAESGMGTSFGDYNNDGLLDLIVTNYQAQTNTLYENRGGASFWDVTSVSRLSEPTLIPLSWGTEFVDLDNDGWLDLFFANGHLEDAIELLEEVGTYKQRNQLFWNRRDGTFVDISAACGTGLLIQKSSRGATFGDYDNDGDMDILISNIGDPPDLLRNDTPRISQWLGVSLVGTHANRDGIGARVTVTVGETQQSREVKSGASYLSQNDLRLLFGLGLAKKVDTLTIRWPSGTVDQISDVPAGQWISVVEGNHAIADTIHSESRGVRK